MLQKGFDYWFTNQDSHRSPFPEDIRETLKTKTAKKFSEWLEALGQEGALELREEEMIEMFEMFLFNVALSLTEDTDQRITISYPFMPRCGDVVEDKIHGLSLVTYREIVEKQEEKRQLKVVLKTKSSEKIWQTEFDLPA